MQNAVFSINNNQHEVSIENSPEFRYGKSEILSGESTDITFHQSWYPKGYSAMRFMDAQEFENLKNGLTNCIKRIITQVLGAPLENFRLEDYHKIVTTDADHLKIATKTRDLFPQDFDFPIAKVFSKFEELLGFKLTDINPHNGDKVHIIVRINRPHSNDFNPPHKDIYEAFDSKDYIPQFINLWIPIAGVTPKSSLPIVAASHLLPENRILRTFEGGVVAGNSYRVRMIKEWDGSNALERANVADGEVLFFSSHLVHGLGINEEDDTTRVALEFRLFRRDD
jgi:hypothetical protein